MKKTFIAILSLVAISSSPAFADTPKKALSIQLSSASSVDLSSQLFSDSSVSLNSSPVQSVAQAGTGETQLTLENATVFCVQQSDGSASCSISVPAGN